MAFSALLRIVSDPLVVIVTARNSTVCLGFPFAEEAKRGTKGRGCVKDDKVGGVERNVGRPKVTRR